MLTSRISDRIHYIGVNDRRTDRFEALWPLPYGISYNSYLIIGSDKIAIIDGVEASHGFEQIDEINAITGGRKPDYLIINHMEPDHSGAIRLLRQAYPDITIVGNAQTLKMVDGYFGFTQNTLAVKDGDTLSLGDNTTLSFILTPMVHWPETMMTLLQEENTIFSGDAFGCYGALNGAVIDSQMDITHYLPEMVRYYSNIVGKYGAFVQRALKKLDGKKLSAICSTHGPVWQQHLPEIVSIYDRLSNYQPLDNGVTIVYGSMYGNLERLVESTARSLAERGIKNIAIHNASRDELSDIIADIFRHRGLILAAPTYSDSIFPPVRNVADAIAIRGIKNRLVCVMSTCTWADRAADGLTEILAKAGISPLATVSMKHAVHTDNIQAADNMAKLLADALADTPDA